MIGKSHREASCASRLSGSGRLMCNCENRNCPTCWGKGCENVAGKKRSMYIGHLCDPCARNMPAKYMLPDAKDSDG